MSIRLIRKCATPASGLGITTNWVCSCSTLCTVSHQVTWPWCVSQSRGTLAVAVCAQPYVTTSFHQPGLGCVRCGPRSFAVAALSAWNTASRSPKPETVCQVLPSTSEDWTFYAPARMEGGIKRCFCPSVRPSRT